MSIKYTGIGARKTPHEICTVMRSIAELLDSQNHILRSGGARGADISFEKGSRNKEIYLPYKGFNNNLSKLYNVCDNAIEIAKEFHPDWSKLSKKGKLLMARNSYQVLGLELNEPSEFIICWTENGENIGGTSQALRIAEHYSIPIFNLGESSGIEVCCELESMGFICL